MNARRLLQRAARIVRGLRATVRAWDGEVEYARYLAECARAADTPLDRGRYFARRLEERYRSRARCC